MQPTDTPVALFDSMPVVSHTEGKALQLGYAILPLTSRFIGEVRKCYLAL